MMNSSLKAYGTGRIHKNVSYEDVERAAIGILKSERRPTVETIRKALGGGSPDTIGNALRRFWRDLGARIEGDPAALSRLPADIAGLADGMWRRALTLAGEAAKNDDNGARERLRQLEAEVEIRQRSFELREREIDTQARQRERNLAEAQNHLISLSKALAREQAENEGHRARIGDLEDQIQVFRSQVAALIASRTIRNSSQRKKVAVRSKRLPIKRLRKASPPARRRSPKTRNVAVRLTTGRQKLASRLRSRSNPSRPRGR